MIPGNLAALETAMANHLWQSTFFATLTAILTLALRKNQARVRYCLWLAASIKFLLLFSVLINFGSRLAKLNHGPETQALFYFVIEKVSQPFNQTPGSKSQLASLLSFLPPIIALLWLVGFATAIGLCCERWRRVASAKHSAVAVPRGREVDALRKLERAAGMRRPIALWSSPSSLEPGVLGIIRPVLLWPAQISKHLEDAHLEAILAHEIQHVRRRDNLAAAIHMLVESIFWFHPLVWWLGARLVDERERACDEAVLQLGNAPQIYAESILKTCQFSVASPLACVSGVTGGDLKQRIVRIMSPRSADKLGMLKKLLLTAIGIGAVAGPIVVGLVRAPRASAQSSPVSQDSQPAQQPEVILKAPYRNFATPSQIYQVGGGVSAPKLLFAPDPEFTEKAQKAKYQGVCVLALIVDEQGKPQRIQVVRHLGMGLDKKAVEAVKQYKFEPALRNDKPVAVEVHIEVNFRVN
jgi:bla regulator protein blaR1